MDYTVIRLIRDAAEDVLFGGRWVGQHRQRLVAVRGDHHVVEPLDRSRSGLDVDTVGVPPNRAHGTVQSNAVPKRFGQRLDVPARTARHG